MTTALNSTQQPEPADADIPAADCADTIPMLRGQIDALDEAIINLVHERVRLSRRIQTARINGGGARVELGRERVILDAYRSVLGHSGATLADALLQVCRGER